MTHDKMSEAPDWVKWGLTVFNRAGFPAIAFGVVAYLCFSTLDKQTKVIGEFKEVLLQMRNSIDQMNDTNKRMIEAMYRTRNR